MRCVPVVEPNLNRIEVDWSDFYDVEDVTALHLPSSIAEEGWKAVWKEKPEGRHVRATFQSLDFSCVNFFAGVTFQVRTHVCHVTIE